MTRLSFLLSSAAALLGSAALGAAPAPGIGELSPAEARLALGDYAACVVKVAPAQASKAVVEDWDGDRLTNPRSQLIVPSCVSAAGFVKAMRFQGDNFRAALAEALIARDGAAVADTVALQTVGPLAFNMPQPVRAQTSKGGRVDAAIVARHQAAFDRNVGKILGQQVAECVTRTNPGEVHAIFVTKPASAAEMEALRGLTPKLAACVQANQKIAFDRASLRADFALAYYRLARAARGDVWAGNPTAEVTR